MTDTSVDRVVMSVEAATEALEQLAGSLRQGGFAEGAPAYARMAEVVVAQRLFHDAGDEHLSARFDHLAGVARHIFELLEPYTVAMRRLAAMAPDLPDESAVAAIRAQLERRGRRGATASVLARASHVPHDVTDRVLAALVADGAVVRRGDSEVRSYRLATAKRPRT